MDINLNARQFSCRLGVLRSKQRELTPATAIFLVVVRRWLRAETLHS